LIQLSAGLHHGVKGLLNNIPMLTIDVVAGFRTSC